eukprot:6183974-Pleurochrysis_carterae.AAC.1
MPAMPALPVLRAAVPAKLAAAAAQLQASSGARETLAVVTAAEAGAEVQALWQREVAVHAPAAAPW